jgi:hypothetical protein
MTKYWCVNFDSEACLRHGVGRNCWMMQYQFADDQGPVHQGRKKGAITRNWNQAGKIEAGHWLVAYLPGKRAITGNPFFAVGQVITPRRARTPHDPADTIRAYLRRQRSHDRRTGFVYYTPVFYEDFTDPWVEPNDGVSRYAQRVDVAQWLHFVPRGVSVKGLNLVPRHQTVNAVFEIGQDFFTRIKAALAGQGGMTLIPEEVESPESYFEGAVKTVTVNAYERSRVARGKCIEHHGWNCGVCGFAMAELYGPLGERVIHVHHLRELASLGEEYEVDPIADLRPVCPNCHAILHTSTPAMTVTELRAALAGRKPLLWPRTPRVTGGAADPPIGGPSQ